MITDFLVPVLDILHGQAVWARQGERHFYRPLKSKLCDSTEPVDVALAARAAIGSNTLYIADLDSLVHHEPISLHVVETLLEEQFQIWLDADWSQLTDEAHGLLTDLAMGSPGDLRPILSSESHRDFAHLNSQFSKWRDLNPVFSFDLLKGTPIWNGELPDVGSEISHTEMSITKALEKADSIGFRSSIVLDIGFVGSGVPRLSKILGRIQLPGEMELISGGGVNDSTDVQAFVDAGCDHVLISTALHQGVW